MAVRYVRELPPPPRRYSTRRRPEWALRRPTPSDQCSHCEDGTLATHYLLSADGGPDPVPLGVACEPCAVRWLAERNAQP